jgi:hypothetical protein
LWWRRMEISWTDPAREEVGLLHRVKRWGVSYIK